MDNECKRKKSSDSEESNSQKRRKTVSPIKTKPFDALEHCRKMCTEFRTDPKHYKYAQFFLNPVDPVALQCPNYYEIIKRPMDLTTIQKKLDNHEYTSEEDFAFDMRLMFQNCFQYNGPDHQIGPFCQLFQDAFEGKFSRLKKSLEKAKVTIFEKLDQAEKSVRNEIAKYELILEDLRAKLEAIIEQRKEEELKMKQSKETFMPKEKPKKSEKSKVKPIKAVSGLPQKSKKKSSKDPKRKKTRKAQEKLPSPPPQLEAAPLAKSDSDEDDTAASMSFDEMRNLSLGINKLSQNHLRDVLNILQKLQPEHTHLKDDELEIDFKNLKPITLRTLEKFVTDVTKLKPIPKPLLRGKMMQMNNAEEIEKQRIDLESQLQTINDQLGLGPKKKTAPTPPPKKEDNSSSSDSDSNGSSSSSSSSSDTTTSDSE